MALWPCRTFLCPHLGANTPGEKTGVVHHVSGMLCTWAHPEALLQGGITPERRSIAVGVPMYRWVKKSMNNHSRLLPAVWDGLGLGRRFGGEGAHE